VSGPISQIHSFENIFIKYLKAHLIYQVSFFYGFQALKCFQASSFFLIGSLIVVDEKLLRPDKQEWLMAQQMVITNQLLFVPAYRYRFLQVSKHFANSNKKLTG
jgi:hypothetical protein